jgi:alkylation response protein AidB-like acyl-CoA dehydrogenase
MGTIDQLPPPHEGTGRDVSDEQFRSDLARYFGELRAALPPRSGDWLQWQRDVARRLADDGHAMPSWPREWGGMELSLPRQLIYHETVARSGVRAHPSPQVGIIGPTLIVHGSPWQRERFIRPLLRADELWTQGFSEPDAGSDLQAIRTRAVREGDDYLVNGQKTWTSMADVADWMFLLVRTGTNDSREAGITYLLLDMTSPGITVRPLRDMAGGTRFCEVFLEDVRVPVRQRVGEENRGWSIARTSLGHERSTAFVGRAVGYRSILDQLYELARRQGASSDRLIRDRLADLEIHLRLQIFNGIRSVEHVLRHGDPGPSAAVARLSHSSFEQRLHEVALDVIGSRGMLARNDPNSIERGRWITGFLKTRASTIGAGTAEVQRNTIAEGVLGLPHDPAMPRPVTIAPTGA